MKKFFKNKSRFKFNSRYILSAVVVILMVASSMLVTSAQPSEIDTNQSRTGSMGNQPSGGYFEGDDIFEIYHQDNTHNTSFNIGETVYIRLTTPRVQDLLANNELIVRSYDDNRVVDLDPGFTQVAATSPYQYESSFVAPSPADHYLVEANIEDDGGEIFRVYDTIIVGNGSSPLKFIRTYSDSDYSNLQTTFVSYDTVYVEVFQNSNPSQPNSRMDIRNYQDDRENKNIRNLDDSSLTWHQNNYARFAINLETDLSWSLQDDHWYILSTEIRNNAGSDICKRWSVQIHIKRPPDVSEGITSVNSPVDVVGANQVMITSQFTNPEVLPASAFTVSLKLREPDDSTEISLVNQKTHGGSGELGGTVLITLNSATHIYTVSYSFDPTESWTLGSYDLYFFVENSYGHIEDGFDNNGNELNLFSSLVQPPNIEIGITKCIPSSVDIFGTGTVTIYSEFTDAGSPDLSTFNVTFKIRTGGQPEINLVDYKANGGAGEFGGTVSIEFAGGMYTASYTWDPDPSFYVGSYDLYFEVDDGESGSDEDRYGNNQDELTIINSDNVPEIHVGSTTALPSSVDKIGKGVVTIYSEFIDIDLPEASTFNVTFKVRDQQDNEIVLVNKKSSGQTSEFGEIVNVEYSGTIYTASVTWDPDNSVLTGWYDLYFEVEDANGNFASDSFNANRDELQIISSINPPDIDSTICIPTSVSKIGSGTTTIYSTFTDEKYNDISNFTVTFKVRAPDGTVYNLTTNTGHGGTGEYGSFVTISFSGTVFTASYAWNPPDNVPTGDYDLYSSIQNGGGGVDVDGFNNNANELSVETTENPPEILDTQCIPSSLSVLGSAKTQLFVTFTDDDNPAVGDFMITFKVRDEDDNEIIIVESKSNGLQSALGEVLNLTYSGTEYTASIFWDPPENAVSGKYDLYSAVLEKSGALIEHDFDENEEELTLTDGIEPGAPTLTESYSFDVETGEYNFTAVYTDPDDEPPNDDGVILTIGSNSYKMIEADPNDEDYDDGKEYYYPIILEDGDYTYGFKVTNDDDEVYQSADTPLKVGPDEKKSDDSETSGMALALLALIIIIILILIIVMVMKKKSKPSSTEPDQRVGEGTPVAEDELSKEDSEEPPQAEPAVEETPEEPTEGAPEEKPEDAAKEPEKSEEVSEKESKEPESTDKKA